MAEHLTPDEIREHQRLLLRLQRVDGELQAVRARIAARPERIAEARRHLAGEEKRLAELEAKSEDHSQAQRECEREIQSRDEKIRRLDAQLFQVKSQREYDAILHEQATLRAEIGEMEDRELQIIEEDEKHAESLRRQSELVERLRAETEREVARLEALLAEDEATRDALERDRPGFVEPLPLRTLDRYDALSERFPGTAVSTVLSKTTCGGCQMLLVAQTLLDVDQGVTHSHCEHCGRLLVPPEIFESETRH